MSKDIAAVETGIDVYNSVIVKVVEHNEKLKLDVRHYYENKLGVLAPTKKGIRIPLDSSSELIGAIEAAVSMASED